MSHGSIVQELLKPFIIYDLKWQYTEANNLLKDYDLSSVEAKSLLKILIKNNTGFISELPHGLIVSSYKDLKPDQYFKARKEFYEKLIKLSGDTKTLIRNDYIKNILEVDEN